MSNKFQNIKSKHISLDQSGELQLSEELKDLIAGGISPEDTEEEANVGCKVSNSGCGRQVDA